MCDSYDNRAVDTAIAGYILCHRAIDAIIVSAIDMQIIDAYDDHVADMRVVRFDDNHMSDMPIGKLV